MTVKLKINDYLELFGELGTVYTKRKRQCCDKLLMTLAILSSMKTMESQENGLQPQSGAASGFSTVLLVPLQICHN